MDGDDFPWNSRLSTSSRRYQSRSEMYLGGDGIAEAEDDYKQEYLCPFCADEFDIVGLCCHVDEEHPVELKQGICPICAKRVGMDMVSHITTQHGNILKVQRRRRLRRGTSSSMFTMLRKELREASRQSMFGGHPYTFSASNPDPDPLLSSLVYSSPIVQEPGGMEADSSPELKLDELSGDDSVVKEWNYLSFLRRIRRRRLVNASLYRGYCSPPFLVMRYDPDRDRKGVVLCSCTFRYDDSSKEEEEGNEERENDVGMERDMHQEISSIGFVSKDVSTVQESEGWREPILINYASYLLLVFHHFYSLCG